MKYLFLLVFTFLSFLAFTQIDTTGKIYYITDEMAMFPACDSIKNYETQKKCADKVMLEFIYGNLRWPNEQGAVEGIVVISFIVEKNGSLTNIKVVRGLHPKFDKEALRVINMLPNFIPGKMYDKTVRMKMNLPVRFRLL